MINIYIYHISSFSANCNCWGYRCNPIFRRTSQDDFRDGMYQGRWRSWNETSGSTSRFMNRRSGPSGVRCVARRKWVYMDLRRHQTGCETRKPLFFVATDVEQLNWNGSTWDLSRHRSKTWSMSTRRRNDRWTTPGTTTFRKSSWTEGLGTMAEESSESDILSYFVEICWNLSKSWASIFDIAFSDRFTPRKAICLRDLHWQIATASEPHCLRREMHSEQLLQMNKDDPHLEITLMIANHTCVAIED